MKGSSSLSLVNSQDVLLICQSVSPADHRSIAYYYYYKYQIVMFWTIYITYLNENLIENLIFPIYSHGCLVI